MFFVGLQPRLQWNDILCLCCGRDNTRFMATCGAVLIGNPRFHKGLRCPCWSVLLVDRCAGFSSPVDCRCASSHCKVQLFEESLNGSTVGDHFAYYGRDEGLTIMPQYNHGSIAQQLESVRKLLDYDFLHVLPGHFRRYSFKNADDRLKQVTEFIQHESALA